MPNTSTMMITAATKAPPSWNTPLLALCLLLCPRPTASWPFRRTPLDPHCTECSSRRSFRYPSRGLPPLFTRMPERVLLRSLFCTLAYSYSIGAYGGGTFVHRESEKNLSRFLVTWENSSSLLLAFRSFWIIRRAWLVVRWSTPRGGVLLLACFYRPRGALPLTRLC